MREFCRYGKNLGKNRQKRTERVKQLTHQFWHLNSNFELDKLLNCDVWLLPIYLCRASMNGFNLIGCFLRFLFVFLPQ